MTRLRADSAAVDELRQKAREATGVARAPAGAGKSAPPPPAVGPTPPNKERFGGLEPLTGPWHRETAVGLNGTKFTYLVLDVPLEPWVGLDDVLIEKGYATRATLDANERARRTTEPSDALDPEQATVPTADPHVDDGDCAF